MFVAYWPVLGFVVGLVLVALFTVLALASRVCRTRHETLPERPLQSYLPETVSPVSKGLFVCLGFGSFLLGARKNKFDCMIDA